MTQDDRHAIRDYYDAVADVERNRLTRDLPGRVSFEVHRRFLADLVQPGQRVLEIGAGPGRFTTVLAELGARVVVTDWRTAVRSRTHSSEPRMHSVVCAASPEPTASSSPP